MSRSKAILFADMLLLILIAVLFSGCASARESGEDGKLSKHTILVGERERSYLLYTPANANRNSGVRPLVLVFHGGGGTAKGIAREVGRSLHKIADRDGFFVAYPNAVDKMWDLGAGVISESLDVRIDDRGYFGDLVDELVRTLPIDDRRIFATGISRGGQASYFVACAHADRIRAIAPVAMPMPAYMLEECAAAPGTGIAILNGTDDPLVPYDGGRIKVGKRERDKVISTDATVEFWRSKNQCSAEASDEQVINTKRDRMQVRRTSWERCEHGPVVLYRIEGGGHTWPSGRQYLPRFVVGRVNKDIDGADEIWSFFSQFR